MKVRELIVPYLRVQADSTISDVAHFMDSKITASVLVEEKGKPVGVITERDILRKVVAKHLDPTKIFARDIMSSPIISIDENAELEEASKIMDEKNIRRVAVINAANEIIGKITSKKIARSMNMILSQKLIGKSSSYRGTVVYK